MSEERELFARSLLEGIRLELIRKLEDIINKTLRNGPDYDRADYVRNAEFLYRDLGDAVEELLGRWQVTVQHLMSVRERYGDVVLRDEEQEKHGTWLKNLEKRVVRLEDEDD